ncbi:right-handed parallel beta-helix repeat-containing protein [Flammeovirga aprica]|uniref:Right-handed parallel beta-helix repeat-containing protein n=1 Tax=Flammeovirga aprica JL-4 TaxID=694437 RepID=A0A7X9RX39_9BACT|nr:right-handed parallel beta-helix repeat-containing protein [Flammeovirga aprica]NME70367.1 right-handed parallel beta-helix repeat-containing protein [Flammeovirga aprica JL-4]
MNSNIMLTFNKQTFITLLFLLFSTSLFAETYYVNSKKGNDKNNGTSKKTAWKTLWKVNQQEFKPGDQILFASGTSYTGQLMPKGSGTEEAVIKIDRYGKGEKPQIDGQGLKESTVYLYNVEYWEVRNLKVTNKGGEAKAKRRGVVVRAEDFGDCHHIVLEGLEIFDVNGVLEKKKGGGSAILWQNKGKVKKTRFINLQILNNYMHHCERNAINSKGNIQRTNWHPSLGVVIRGNLIENIPGDGIVPIGCDGALIEYNIIRKGIDSMPMGDAAAGIWPWSSDNTLVQFNSVSDHRAKWDGQGYDSDFNCFNTTFQYNLSFDNWGGFILICNNGFTLGEPMNKGTENSIVKYNLSINDGIRPYKAHNKRFFAPTFHITGPVNNTSIHHNIVIIPDKEKAEMENHVVEFQDWGKRFPTKTIFENNLVRNQSEAKILEKGAKGFVNQNNDIQKEFDYSERNPQKILEQLQNNPLFENDKEFMKLYEFVKGFF